jgi:hypothetical protein
MSTVQPFPAGGYRFISHQFQYSGGVAAERLASASSARASRRPVWITVSAAVRFKPRPPAFKLIRKTGTAPD